MLSLFNRFISFQHATIESVWILIKKKTTVTWRKGVISCNFMIGLNSKDVKSVLLRLFVQETRGIFTKLPVDTFTVLVWHFFFFTEFTIVAVWALRFISISARSKRNKMTSSGRVRKCGFTSLGTITLFLSLSLKCHSRKLFFSFFPKVSSPS